MGNLDLMFFLLWDTVFCRYTHFQIWVSGQPWIRGTSQLILVFNFTIDSWSWKTCYILSYLLWFSIVTYFKMLAKPSAEPSMSILPLSSSQSKDNSVDIIFTVWVYVAVKLTAVLIYWINRWSGECFESRLVVLHVVLFSFPSLPNPLEIWLIYCFSGRW